MPYSGEAAVIQNYVFYFILLRCQYLALYSFKYWIGKDLEGQFSGLILRFHAGIFMERSLLRHYATSRKVAGSIPDEVIGFFN
jgi:hypothetical protein